MLVWGLFPDYIFRSLTAVCMVSDLILVLWRLCMLTWVYVVYMWHRNFAESCTGSYTELRELFLSISCLQDFPLTLLSLWALFLDSLDQKYVTFSVEVLSACTVSFANQSTLVVWLREKTKINETLVLVWVASLNYLYKFTWSLCFLETLR